MQLKPTLDPLASVRWIRKQLQTLRGIALLIYYQVGVALLGITDVLR